MNNAEIRARLSSMTRDLAARYGGLYAWTVDGAPTSWISPLLRALDRLVTLNPPLSDKLRVLVGTLDLVSCGHVELCVARLPQSGGRAGLLLRRGKREWSLPEPDHWAGLVETGVQLVPAPESEDIIKAKEA
jgi:hypothetical protein